MIKEMHNIKPFRAENLGIIRLKKLAYPRDINITVDNETFKPIGYDTYGHPIISQKNFDYYKALKAIKERKGESLIVEVEYEPMPFSIARGAYDSAKVIQEAITKKEGALKEFKQILIYRKQAHFDGKPLNTFILYGKYALYSDGHIYMCECDKQAMALRDEEKLPIDVWDMSRVDDFELKEEVHIPREDDVCAICGKHFTMEDVKTFSVIEDGKHNKAHRDCLSKFTEAIEYYDASRIIDIVYKDKDIPTPESEIVREYDEDDGEDKVWYKYHTVDGDVGIHFRNKVIEIKWYGKFKPFNLETLFKDEDVTKKRLEDAKVIHAWSPNAAIKYLSMVKNS